MNLRDAKAGVTDSVIAETKKSLASHELIKVRVEIDDTTERRATAEKLAEASDSQLAAAIGKIAVLYRERDEDPDIEPLSRSEKCGLGQCARQFRRHIPKNRNVDCSWTMWPKRLMDSRKNDAAIDPWPLLATRTIPAEAIQPSPAAAVALP